MPSELEKGIYRYVDNSIENAPYTQIYTGLVKASGADGYTISLNGVEYANVPSKGTFLTNDTVKVVVPNNQYSNMFILSDSTGGSGGGTGAVSSVNGMTGDVVISNVASANKLSSAKTITLTGDVTGSVSFDGSANVSITSTVADDSHNHVISNVDGLQTTLDGKANVGAFDNNSVLTNGTVYSNVQVVDGMVTGLATKTLTTANIEPIATKTYSGIIATANNFASSTFYFATIRPTTWYKVWKIKYRIQATSGTDNNYAGASIVEMYGCQANRLTYANFNNHYNTSHRSYFYHDLYSLTSTGYTNGYGHAVGVELTNSAYPTNATYARTFIIDILETENCDVTMLNTMTLYANLVGTGSTNYNGYWQTDGQNNGLRETGDDNSGYDRLSMVNNRLYAGTKGIYGNQLVMQKADGFWESLTSTYSTATNKTKNTSGFLLSNILLYKNGTTVTSGNLTATWNNYVSFDNYTFQYSSNCGTTLTPYKSLYLKGTITNGLFYLADVWWTQTLPTTDDGYVYIYLGETIKTTNFSLYPTHPMYAHVNGYLRNITDYSLMPTGTTSSIVWN